jgi:hypothetical protein
MRAYKSCIKLEDEEGVFIGIYASSNFLSSRDPQNVAATETHYTLPDRGMQLQREEILPDYCFSL